MVRLPDFTTDWLHLNCNEYLNLQVNISNNVPVHSEEEKQ